MGIRRTVLLVDMYRTPLHLQCWFTKCNVSNSTMCPQCNDWTLCLQTSCSKVQWNNVVSIPSSYVTLTSDISACKWGRQSHTIRPTILILSQKVQILQYFSGQFTTLGSSTKLHQNMLLKCTALCFVDWIHLKGSQSLSLVTLSPTWSPMCCYQHYQPPAECYWYLKWQKTQCFPRFYAIPPLC